MLLRILAVYLIWQNLENFISLNCKLDCSISAPLFYIAIQDRIVLSVFLPLSVYTYVFCRNLIWVRKSGIVPIHLNSDTWGTSWYWYLSWGARGIRSSNIIRVALLSLLTFCSRRQGNKRGLKSDRIYSLCFLPSIHSLIQPFFWREL
jgi:hypothetical protein